MNWDIFSLPKLMESVKGVFFLAFSVFPFHDTGSAERKQFQGILCLSFGKTDQGRTKTKTKLIDSDSINFGKEKIVGYDRPALTSVREGFPAEEAGLQKGDEIISMNGSRIHFFREISQYSMFHPGEEVEVVYEREGTRHTVSLNPKMDEETGRPMLGMNGSPYRERGSFLQSVSHSFYEVKYLI